MTEKTLTTENIKPALDALRGELAPWPVVAKKQDRLNTAQLNAANSGITSSLVAQIIANTAAIRALESAITGTGLRALVVSSLPAVGTQGILYIVPVTTYDPATDADVVNYSNEYLWIVAPDAPVTEGYYEQVGQTGIVINNGQLTITVNGTSVGTFTANQSGDTTAAITVPTNADYVDLSTSQTVTGGKTWTGEQSFTLPIVGSITGTASKAIADEDGTSIKTGYVNVAGNQTVTGQKTWSGNQFFTAGAYHRNNSYEIGNTPASNVAMPIYFTDKVNIHTGYVRNVILTTGRTQTELYARNKFTSGALSPTGTDVSSTLQVEVQSNGDKTLYFDGSIRNNVLPYATNTYSLGSSSYQWSSVYAQSYYYNGTEFQSKFVTTDTEQSISQVKEFTRTNSDTLRLKNGRVAIGETISSDAYTQFVFRDKNTDNLAYIRDTYFTDGSTTLSFFARNRYTNGAPSTTGSVSYAYWGIGVDATGKPSASVRGDFAPYSDATYNLGTSTNKWKTLNGINPGALSLPSFSSSDPTMLVWSDLDTTNWLLDGTGNAVSTALDGYVYVSVTCGTDGYVVITEGQYGYPNCFYMSTGIHIAGVASALLPVRKGIGITVHCKGTSIVHARFFPMQGNV